MNLIILERLSPAAALSNYHLKCPNWVHFAHRPWCTITLNSNFANLKNTNLFSMSVKELFEPIVLQRKGDGLLLFSKVFS